MSVDPLSGIEPVSRCDVISRSPEETHDLGYSLGELVQEGDTVLLIGDLGAGKTCFSQGIAEGLGFPGYAASPSFVLVREYQGRVKAFHIDLYRLDGIEEILEIGLEEYLSGRGVCIIEWADKALEFLPAEALLVTFEHMAAENERRLRFEGRGPRHVDLLRQWRKKWNLS